MPSTTAPSSSQTKISHSFRSSAKTPRPLKETKPAVKPVAKAASPTPSVETAQEGGKHLNPSDPTLVAAARSIEGDRQAPFGSVFNSMKLTRVHPENQSTIHTILRNFDLSPRYGPCVGMTRLGRYRRAEKMGLKPPIEVLQILETEEGRRDWNTDLFSQKSAV
jgi:DNA polymerase delta subunit 4